MSSTVISLVVVVMQLRAVGRNSLANPEKDIGAGKHAHSRRNEIDPHRLPVAGAAS